jgi:hypothetical protein
MKTLVTKIVIGISTVTLSCQVQGTVSVSLAPTPQTINVGDPAVMDLIVGGLGDFAAPSLAAFDFDLSYDPSVLTAVSLTFGNLLNLGVLGSVQFSDLSSAGSIHLNEVSLESAFDLNNAQPATFTLATLSFTGATAGFGAIDFTFASLADEVGNVINEVALNSGSIEVVDGPSGVSDGVSSLPLLALGLASIWAMRLRAHAESSTAEPDR